MSSPLIRPLGVEPIEDRILPTGFVFDESLEPPTEDAVPAILTRIHEEARHHAPTLGEVDSLLVGDPEKPFSKTEPGKSEPTPAVRSEPTSPGTLAAVVAAPAQPRSAPSWLAPDGGGRTVSPVPSEHAEETPGSHAVDPTIASIGSGWFMAQGSVPTYVLASPHHSRHAEFMHRTTPAILGLSYPLTGIVSPIVEAAPIVVDLPAGPVMAGELVLDVAALETGAREVLDRIGAIVCDSPDVAEGTGWSTWGTAAAVLAGWAGYTVWANRKVRRPAAIAAGTGSAFLWGGSHHV